MELVSKIEAKALEVHNYKFHQQQKQQQTRSMTSLQPFSPPLLVTEVPSSSAGGLLPSISLTATATATNSMLEVPDGVSQQTLQSFLRLQDDIEHGRVDLSNPSNSFYLQQIDELLQNYPGLRTALTAQLQQILKANHFASGNNVIPILTMPQQIIPPPSTSNITTLPHSPNTILSKLKDIGLISSNNEEVYTSTNIVGKKAGKKQNHQKGKQTLLHPRQSSDISTTTSALLLYQFPIIHHI